MNDDLNELDNYDGDETTDGFSSVSITLPDLIKSNKVDLFYNYTENIVDFNDLNELDRVFNKARKAMFKLTDKINEYERLEILAKTDYDRNHRRQYLLSNEKTEAGKRARADLACEELENIWMKYAQLKSELIRTSHTMRLELQALQTLGNNLRQQLKT